MRQDFFRRIEEKYLLNKEQYNLILQYINKYMRQDEHGFCTICNIYFDTDNFDLIQTSLEKPIYKEKIRLRSYNTPTLQSNVFLEIKKKYCGIVSKRRIEVPLCQIYDYLDKGIYPYCNKQIMKEIDYCFQKYELKPQIYLSYDRNAYYSVSNSDFRLTFDTNIKSRNEDLKLELGNHGKKLYKNKFYIMEVKTLDAFPLWFTNILSELKLYPTSFSKYGKVYQAKVLESR